MAGEKKTPESQLRATKKYLSQFAEFRIRIAPEYRTEIHQHAKAMGESTAAFVKRAIAETMERDRKQKEEETSAR